MKLKQVEIENFRAISLLSLPLNNDLTVLYGKNADGKTSVLSAIAVGLGSIPRLLPDVSGIDFRKNDLRGKGPMRVQLTTRQGITWRRQRHSEGNRTAATKQLQDFLSGIVEADHNEGSLPKEMPIVAYYDTDRAVIDDAQRKSRSRRVVSSVCCLERGSISSHQFSRVLRLVLRKGIRGIKIPKGYDATQGRAQGSRRRTKGNQVNDTRSLESSHRLAATALRGVNGIWIG